MLVIVQLILNTKRKKTSQLSLRLCCNKDCGDFITKSIDKIVHVSIKLHGMASFYNWIYVTGHEKWLTFIKSPIYIAGVKAIT